MKKKIISLLLVLTLIFSTSLPAFAQSSDNVVLQTSEVGGAGSIYYTDADFVTDDPNYIVQELVVVPNAISFEYTSEVQFVDVMAKLTNNTYVNVTEWTSASVDGYSDLITYDRGRIDSIGVGQEEVIISYGGKSCSLEVVVNHDNNPYLAPATNEIELYTYEAGQVLARSRDCLDYTWTPTMDLVRWRNNGTYEANVQVEGMPYTQANQAYPVTYVGYAELSFPNAMQYGDFYTPYTNASGITMPRYGLDCSGFLSYCMGTTRKTTQTFMSGLRNGTYAAVGEYDPLDFLGYSNGKLYVLELNSTLKNELKEAYDDMLSGWDGLVNSGHCMLVCGLSRDSERVTVREQTPSGTAERVYTYSQLADDGYLPFRFL